MMQNAINNESSNQVHWLHILYAYCHDSIADLGSTNAVVFRENSHLILETVHPIASKTIIHAIFHDLSWNDLISLTQGNLTNKFSTLRNFSTQEYHIWTKILKLLNFRSHYQTIGFIANQNEYTQRCKTFTQKKANVTVWFVQERVRPTITAQKTHSHPHR